MRRTMVLGLAVLAVGLLCLSQATGQTTPKKTVISIEDLDCPVCAKDVEKAVAKVKKLMKQCTPGARHAVLAFEAYLNLPPGKTDEDYVKALLHATGVLCVYGSGFGLPKEDGFLRIVFLAPLDELREIYDLMARFTQQYLA